MTTLERLRTTLAALSLTAIDTRLEALLEGASKQAPAYADFLLEEHALHSGLSVQTPQSPVPKRHNPN